MIQIPILSTAIQSWQFAGKAFAAEKRKSRLKQQRKSFFLALINPRIAAKWFNIIQSPDFKLVMAHRPAIYLKPFRVYISTKWSKDKKIKVIQDTYRFITSKGDGFTKVITAEKGLEIARFKMSDIMEGYLTLGYDGRYRKEGELVLTFHCDQLEGKMVAIAFSFEEVVKDHWVCWIGCVQGHGVNEANSSKIAQKQLQGLRPKSLVVLMVQELSRHLGLSSIYGAGDLIQAYRKKHAIHLPWRHTINFNYNEFWLESGGVAKSEGWYELPLTPVRKDIQDIKSEKRAYYRRRYAILDDLSLKIAESVNKLEV